MVDGRLPSAPEGGRLGLLDDLPATFGLLVPVEFLVAILAAVVALR